MRGLMVLKLACLGIMRFCIMRMTLITLAAPDAASVWPMLSFTEPRKTSSSRLELASARRTLSYSMGSPTGVPVPWAST